MQEAFIALKKLEADFEWKVCRGPFRTKVMPPLCSVLIVPPFIVEATPFRHLSFSMSLMPLSGFAEFSAMGKGLTLLTDRRW